MDKKKFLGFLRIGVRWFAMIIVSILIMSGFLRFVELNTYCEDDFSYYQFLDLYCEKSGFFNYKVRCEIPVGVSISCYNDMLGFSFPVVKSGGSHSGIVDYNYENNYYDDFIIDYNV
jgi:hypothetical protein